jgi:imidazolonepropionase
MIQKKLIGPFKQLLTLNNLSIKGPLSDNDLEIIENAGVLIESDFIVEVGAFDTLAIQAENNNYKIEEQRANLIALPGFIDPHTHICWAGSRAKDYTMRLNGKSYLQIAEAGGGIWSTVKDTRDAYINELTKSTIDRAYRHLKDGVTTIEVKSGYGLTIEDELKILQSIKNADLRIQADLISTCLAAHISPKDYKSKPSDYLQLLIRELLPIVKEKGLANRVDIYIDKSAFEPKDAKEYLLQARQMGFEITVHADQFKVGGSAVALEVDSVSADHLESSGKKEIQMLAKGNVIPVALPASSIGLGNPFAPARKLLDNGASLAVGSDWNPGSAPMGDLLISAALLGMYEKLTNAETFAAITVRAAAALDLKDRGIIKPGNIADIVAFELDNYT